MVKAIVGNQIMLGLSDENIKRLKAGQGIKFNMSELGLKAMDVMIFQGKDEQTMLDQFRSNIGPDTTVG